jgi:hypothetical protein
MGHLLKIKCADSIVNVHLLALTSVPFTSAKFSTNSQATDYSVDLSSFAKQKRSLTLHNVVNWTL